MKSDTNLFINVDVFMPNEIQTKLETCVEGPRMVEWFYKVAIMSP